MKSQYLKVLLIALSVLAISFAQADSNTVSVAGSASVNVEPNQATIYVYVTGQGGNAANASNSVDSQIANILSVLQNYNIPKSNIGTSSYSVYPKYDYSTGVGVINGYYVYASLTITIVGISSKNDQLANVIDAIATAGVNSVSGITWSNSNPNKGKDQARTAAFNEAKANAAQYAKLSGRKLGKIIQIQQTVPGYSYSSTPVAGQGGNSLPIGDVIVVVNVIVIWALI